VIYGVPTGRRLPGARERAGHEANHAAVLCLAGLVPTCVRTDFPNQHEAGAVTVDWGEGGYRDPARATDVLVSVIVGGFTEGPQGWTWENFPVDPGAMAEGAVGDALMVRELLEYFGLGVADWAHALWKADQLGRRRDFRGLVVRIADELERVEVLNADDLRALMEPEREAVAA
jgi:hypothetical protein